MKILITGGAGYIGSHTCLQLLRQGFEVVVIDNLSNSKKESLEAVKLLSGKHLHFYNIDLLDLPAISQVFADHTIDAVIHFAGVKSVTESINIPLHYYTTNIVSTLNLCATMLKFKVYSLVFSSSAVVYGDSERVPITEDSALIPTNPYGKTKVVIENILRDLHTSNPIWQIAILRYFNPTGSDNSGLIGEDPILPANNLFPIISSVAAGKLKELQIYGNDYPTLDGTCVRDYVHVTDLANGHIRVLKHLETSPGMVTYNLGAGKGYSVIEVVEAFSKACNQKIPYRIVPRRRGEIAVSYANSDLIFQELGWKAEKDLDSMCADSWKWQVNNINGYK